VICFKRMIQGSAPTARKVLREVATERNCPWCFRKNLTYAVFTGGTVRAKCAGACGYEATLFRRELKPDEVSALFGPVKGEAVTEAKPV